MLISALKRLEAELGAANGAPKKAKRAPVNGEFDLFRAANDVDTLAVLDRLSIAHSSSPRGTMAVCPGCGEDGALVCRDGGLKCLHGRCAGAGPPAHPGLRSNVDLVMHVQQIDKVAAAKQICEWFGIEIPNGAKKATATEPPPPGDDYEHSESDAPDAPPAEEASSTGDNAKRSQPTIELMTLGSLVGPALDRAVRRRDRIDLPVPVPFREWSEALGGGLWPGSHHVVSGTGVGKSQLTIDTALRAALTGIPVVYIGLELDQMQIALRVLGEQSRTRWSDLYLGRFNDTELERARGAVPALGNIPFYCDFGPPRGWPVGRLGELARSVRQKHPTGPMLLVLDYLQLVSDEPGAQRRLETREKIGNAAYQTKAVASAYDASVLVVSSAARTHYGLLAGDAKEAGLITRKTQGHFEAIKIVAHPHILIGLGKESGDVEFAADTVTTLIRWPAPLDNGETAIIAAVPKVRAGIPRWFALSFSGRFTELPIKGIDELPVREGQPGRPAVGAQDLESRLLAALRKLGPTKTKRELVAATEGEDRKLYAAIKTLMVAGKILLDDKGAMVAAETADAAEGAQQ